MIRGEWRALGLPLDAPEADPRTKDAFALGCIGHASIDALEAREPANIARTLSANAYTQHLAMVMALSACAAALKLSGTGCDVRLHGPIVEAAKTFLRLF